MSKTQYQAVLGLEIAVNDVLGVEVGHGAGELKGQLRLVPPRQPNAAVLETLTQITGFHILVTVTTHNDTHDDTTNDTTHDTTRVRCALTLRK